MKILQLNIFSDTPDVLAGGRGMCSFQHETPRKAAYTVVFKNGIRREACSRCAKKYGKKRYSNKVERIEPLNKVDERN